MPTLAGLRTITRTDPLLASTTVISDANLNTILNLAAVQFANDADAFVLSATWSGVASTQRYVLSGGASPQVSNFLDVYWEAGGLIYSPTSTTTKTHPNDWTFTSESWLDLHFPGWQDDTASDTLQHAFLGYDSSGFLNLGVHPATSTTTPTFKLYFKSRGTDMDGDTKYPWVNSTSVIAHTEPYHLGIAWWAMWHLHTTKTKQDTQAQHYLQLYQQQVLLCKDAQRKIVKAEIEGLRQDARVTASDSFGGI